MPTLLNGGMFLALIPLAVLFFLNGVNDPFGEAVIPARSDTRQHLAVKRDGKTEGGQQYNCKGFHVY